uniref:Max dimerization protein 1-like n=1 Tax=Timema genevievae TaxID=629358 RepID=A0A7R9K7C2_TIMGE|nr:unnamed protein product [Timema genevievae]
MSIAALLRAAEYLERKDREAEHGYASTLPMPDDLRSVTKRPKTKKSQGSRTTHNELEKNRIYLEFLLLCVCVTISTALKGKSLAHSVWPPPNA